MLKTFYTREADGWWHVAVKDDRFPPLAVRGRSIQHGRNKLKAELRSVVRTKKLKIKDMALDERINLPRELERKVREYKSARDRAEAARIEAKMRQESAVYGLLEQQVSTRDCAAILGVSRQRAQQLLDVQRKLKEDGDASPR